MNKLRSMRTIWLKNVLRKITMFFNLFFSTTFLINRNYSTDLSGTRNENKRLPAGWISFAGTDDACNSEHGSMHHLYRFLFTEKAREMEKELPLPDRTAPYLAVLLIRCMQL